MMKRGLCGPVAQVLMKSMTAKVAKPLTNGRKVACDRISFLMPNKNCRVAGKNYGRSGNRKHTYIFSWPNVG